MALAISMSTFAVRAVHKLFPQKQSDGTTVMLYTNGNGRLAFYTTEDDQVVIRDANGTLCYAELKDGKLVPTTIAVHNLTERTAAEKSFVASNKLKPTDEALSELFVPVERFPETRNRLLKASQASTSDGLGKYGTPSLGPLPSIGKITIPVIMVEFSDVKFQEASTIEKYSRFMNEEGYNEDSPTQQVGSVRDYFLSQSRGMFDPTFDVVAKVTLDKSCAYYGGDTYTTDPNIRTMLSDAITMAEKQGVDFDKYEQKYVVPNIIFIYAGYGQATGGSDDTIWPHASELGNYYGQIGNHIFSSYFVGNELYGGSGNRLMGMGVMVHELGHVLGLPDIYDTQYTYQASDAPMGDWSVMDSGEYYPQSTGYAPVGYNAYERSYMGWLDLRELKDAEAVKLMPEDDPEGEFAVLLRNPSSETEYFILENRAEGKWFPKNLGTGLLLQRYAYNASLWSTNRVNSVQAYKRAMVVTASGRKMPSSSTGLATDLYGNGVNNIESFPLFNTTQLETPVFRIMKNPDGVLTFNFKDKSLVNGYSVSNDDVYEKVIDSTTLTSGDKIVFVNEGEKLAMTLDINNYLLPAVPVKIEDGKAYGNDMVTPLTLRASGSNWLMLNGNKYLTAVANGFRFAPTMSAASIVTMGIDNGDAYVTFGGTVKKKNLGFDTDGYLFDVYELPQGNVQIYRLASTTGISMVNAGAEAKKSDKMFNLAGQQVDANYKGIVIVNGKKVLKK